MQAYLSVCVCVCVCVCVRFFEKAYIQGPAQGGFRRGCCVAALCRSVCVCVCVRERERETERDRERDREREQLSLE